MEGLVSPLFTSLYCVECANLWGISTLRCVNHEVEAREECLLVVIDHSTEPCVYTPSAKTERRPFVTHPI